LSYFSVSTRMNGAGNGKLDAVDKGVAVEENPRCRCRCRGRRALLALRAGAVDRGLDLSDAGPAGVDRHRVRDTSVVADVRERAADTHALQVGVELRRRRLLNPQLKVPSGHKPTNPTLSGGFGSRGVPASMKLSVSTINRPSTAVEPSGHWNGINQRAEATSSRKPFAADATPGTASNARAATRTPTKKQETEPLSGVRSVRDLLRDHKGGAEGTRTPDPLHAMQMRYQLRHSPGLVAAQRRQLGEC
jgi:hypothetical protein